MNESINIRLKMARMNQQSGALDQAEALARQAVDSNPEHAEANLTLGSIYLTMNESELAEQYIRKASELAPDSRDPHFFLGWIHRMRLRHTESVEAFKRAATCQPDNLSNWQDVIFSMQYCPNIDPEEEFSFIKSTGNFIERKVPRLFFEYENPADPIRIGYLGSEIRTHSVSYFLLPVILRHSDRYQVHIYNTGRTQDAMTERIKGSAHRYRYLFGMSSEDVARQIHADNIDILVDLDGYTEVTTLRVFCHRPAALQLSWIGYPGTTGLECMHYRIVDELTDPVDGIADRIHTEALIRLPESFSVYSPPSGAPGICDTPVIERGYVTFGSFNNPYKLNPEVVGVWAEILHAVPGSILMLKYPTLENPVIRESIVSLFSEHDIQAERLIIIPERDDIQKHFERYHDIDIALDPFPYSGTTTTCDALWMGVPVISLAGEKHISRVGLSQLSNIGLHELVAKNREDYVRIAKELAERPNRLNEMRLQMRERMSHSPLMDADRFIATFESSLEEIRGRHQQNA